MLATLTKTLETVKKTFSEMPVGKQIAVIGMIAGGLVTVIAILFWTLRTEYAPLFSQIDDAQAAEVVKALNQLRVPYRIENATGKIDIPKQQVAETRLLLAGQGLPKAADIGFELLQKDQGFGVSRLIEGARYQRALEGELGRSIASLEPVKEARVHIAQPERSVFVRERTPPSASVVVHLRDKETLTDAQVAAIVHLIASSVPELKPERVTIVDQRGHLMNLKDEREGMDVSLDHLEYTHRVEASYVERVENLLTPIIGRDRVRVQVAAEIDFSRVERTQENYDPDRTAVRSEQTSEEERVGDEQGIGGIPGSLTNQPPAGGVVGQASNNTNNNKQTPSKRSQQATRNYEVDHATAKIQEMPGGIRRLSTAVVVDYQEQTDDKGKSTRVPRSDADLENLRALVRGAVGFNEKRGDLVSVTSASFIIEAGEGAMSFWSEPGFLELIKTIGGFLLAIIVLFGIVKPGLNQLIPKPEPPPPPPPPPVPELPSALEPTPVLESAATPPALTDKSKENEEEKEEKVVLSQEGTELSALEAPPKEPEAPLSEIEQQQLDLETIRAMIREDPKRAIHVMRAWLAEDGE